MFERSLQKLYEHEHGGYYFLRLCYVIGIIQLILLTSKVVNFAKMHFWHKKQDLKAKYFDKNKKEGSWAVVTGGSDGIGLQFCIDLAKQGFDICIVARNEQKIKERLEEIKKEAKDPSKIKTSYVVADFAKMTTIDEYQKVLGDGLKGKDVAMLVLNAGWIQAGPTVELTDKELQDQISVNALHVIYSLKVVGPLIMERPKRAGVIIVGSQFGEFPSSGYLTYGATKAFAKYVGQGINFEWKEKADVLTLCPGEIATKLNPGKPNALKIVPKKLTAAAFRDIGRVSWSYGNIMHEFPFGFLMLLPTKRVQKMFYGMSKKILKKVRQKQEQAKKDK